MPSRHDAPTGDPAHRPPRPQARSPVLYRTGGRVQLRDGPRAVAPPEQRETVLGGLPVVIPSREKAVWGGLWCRKLAHRLGIPAPRLRWYSGPEWVPFGFCPDPLDEPATIYVRSNMPIPFTISTIAHELVHYGGGDEKAAQRYEHRVAPLIETRFGPVVRPVQPGRARLNASWRRSVAGELVVV